MSISVVIGTYGDDRWRDLAAERALPSVAAQTVSPASVHHCHGRSLHEARNAGGQAAMGEWLCFLDADDELDPFYLEAMLRVLPDGDGLLQPATLGVVDGREDPYPVVIPSKPLIDGNYMVIGTLIRRSQFLDVGGFRDLPYAEDWDLWIRARLAGAQLMAVHDAIYRVHVNPNGRNSCDRQLQVQTYNRIRSQYRQEAARLR